MLVDESHSNVRFDLFELLLADLLAIVTQFILELADFHKFYDNHIIYGIF